MRRACALAPPVVDGEAIENHLAELRLRRGLTTPEAEADFYALYALPPGSLRRFAVEEVTFEALREREVGGLVGGHFAQHRGDYDRVVVGRLVAGDADRAQEIADAVRSGARDLVTAAEEELHRSLLPSVALTLSPAWRRDLPAVLRGTVVAGREVLGIVQVRPAELDADLRRAIRDELFEAWLAPRRAAAVVRWNWGPALLPPATPEPSRR
jgi:hypothetical protein